MCVSSHDDSTGKTQTIHVEGSCERCKILEAELTRAEEVIQEFRKRCKELAEGFDKEHAIATELERQLAGARKRQL